MVDVIKFCDNCEHMKVCKYKEEFEIFYEKIKNDTPMNGAFLGRATCVEWLQKSPTLR